MKCAAMPRDLTQTASRFRFHFVSIVFETIETKRRQCQFKVNRETVAFLVSVPVLYLINILFLPSVYQA